jgi:hypothetical protein
LTVYVETNFVIDLALGQEESQPAEDLLSGAENGLPISA